MIEQLAEKIYNDLNEKGAGLGNMAELMITKSIRDFYKPSQLAGRSSTKTLFEEVINTRGIHHELGVKQNVIGRLRYALKNNLPITIDKMHEILTLAGYRVVQPTLWAEKTRGISMNHVVVDEAMEHINGAMERAQDLVERSQPNASSAELRFETIQVIDHDVVGNVSKSTWKQIDRIQKEDASKGNRFKFNIYYSDINDSEVVKPLVVASGQVLFKRIGTQKSPKASVFPS